MKHMDLSTKISDPASGPHTRFHAAQPAPTPPLTKLVSRYHELAYASNRRVLVRLTCDSSEPSLMHVEYVRQATCTIPGKTLL